MTEAWPIRTTVVISELGMWLRPGQRMLVLGILLEWCDDFFLNWLSLISYGETLLVNKADTVQCRLGAGSY